MNLNELLALGSTAVPLLARLGIDLAAMLLLVFGLYYRRYREKELVTAAALFNVLIFAVLTMLSQVEFGLAAGFGLFAILAMFTLRSEPIGKTEISYFFGSVAIAVICSVQGTTLPFVTAVAAVVVLGAWIIDHGIADAVLRRHHQHPTSGCSKYCVGMSVTGGVQRFNRFRPALRKLGALPAAVAASLSAAAPAASLSNATE